MATLFLRAKAWQLFLAIVLLAAVGYWASNFLIFEASPGRRFLLAQLDPLVFFPWAWFAGLFLSSILAPRLRFKMPFFRFSILYFSFYFLGSPMLRQIRTQVPPGTFLITGGVCLICMINVVYSLATSLKSAETGLAADFYDSLSYFLAILIFPIGVWFVQPKINRLYDQNPSNHRSAIPA
jgi:hypothetical protein